MSGGGNNSKVSTTYIALFRIEQRQVQFSSGSPLSISDGDEVVVAGRSWRGALYADAVRNVATGLTRHSGIVSRVFASVIVLPIGTVFSIVVAGFFGAVGAGFGHPVFFRAAAVGRLDITAGHVRRGHVI